MSQESRRAFVGDRRGSLALAAGKVGWWGVSGLIARRMNAPHKGPAARVLHSSEGAPDPRALRRAWFEAFAKDARDVGAGLYPPTEALPRRPLETVGRALDLIRDARAVDHRRRGARGTEVREEGMGAGYPAYYRQNFHYQSGGWLTKESAQRYEAQVEVLFSGAAGAMRRRALSLLAGAVRDADQRALVVLDLACGSGSFLGDLKATFPRSLVLGVDLSLPYAAEARRRSGAALAVGAAERLPLADGALDAVTCIYLFHELPPKVRGQVAREIARVLRPGGRLAFADSVQKSDVPEVARLLDAFPVFFHEPFYESYQALDLPALFADAGLRLVGADQAFLTKALLFEKAPA